MTLEDQKPDPVHELDLLRRFLAGERGAHRTVEGWAREIVRFRPYGIHPSEHDDIVQQSLGMLWRACSRSDFALRWGVRAMIRKIVLARCVDHLRRRRPSQELEENLVDPSPSPLDVAVRDDRWAQLERALWQLNDRCREVIRLHFLDGLAYSDLAAKMGLAPATVRVRMFHCIKEVRRLLNLEDLADEGSG